MGSKKKKQCKVNICQEFAIPELGQTKLIQRKPVMHHLLCTKTCKVNTKQAIWKLCPVLTAQNMSFLKLN